VLVLLPIGTPIGKVEAMEIAPKTATMIAINENAKLRILYYVIILDYIIKEGY
jgi:hypothetical protein